MDDGLFDDQEEMEDDYMDYLDDALDDCGYDEDYAGVCWSVGTEHCSFFCPFYHIYFSEEK